MYTERSPECYTNTKDYNKHIIFFYYENIQQGKNQAGPSDFMLPHQKDFCYQTHRGNTQLKINHVLKAGNSFSQRNNVLKMARFQNYFKRAHLPPVVYL